MRRPRALRGTPLAILCLALASRAGAFDLEAYRAHLDRIRDLSADELIESRRPYGPYVVAVPPTTSPPEFLDVVVTHYGLTPGEQSLLRRHGFVVSERLPFPSFGHAFEDVWHADLPVFVSTDAILHALHRSYVTILATVETAWLAPLLDQALDALHARWQGLNASHAGEPRLRAPLDDVDIYLTVARSLLVGQRTSSMGGNDAQVRELMDLIAAEAPASYPLFNTVPRTCDFSQLKVRGHYTQSPELRRYFQAMMWLGRSEFRLTEPPGLPRTADVTREIVGAFLVRELVQSTAAAEPLAAMERQLRALVGASDNVTLAELDALAEATEIQRPEELLEPAVMTRFRAELATGRYTAQGINSQILIADPMHPEDLDPPYAFLLLGQRFILDSFITWNVVYDRIEHRGSKVFRGLPATLDILYALGNDDVLPLLDDELQRFHYAPNLSALRYLVDGYERDSWRQSLYTSWLHAIRTLAMSGREPRAPDFMRTAAWQQQKMNTQLAAWAELRHDNLLYAKQSYTGGAVCSYPRTFVEPVPEFYRVLAEFAQMARGAFAPPAGLPTSELGERVGAFFERMAVILERLTAIADKELTGTPFSVEEQAFLCEVLYPGGVCAPTELGWYRELYFGDQDEPAKIEDLIVADVHTQPTDAGGNPVGYVLHAATGAPEMGVFLAVPPGGALTAFVGPVSTYHEHVTAGFLRLTDEEWRALYAATPPARPDWTHVYLADAEGRERTTGRRLVPDPTPVAAPPRARVVVVLEANVPNPFNPSTRISFRLDAGDGADTDLAVYDSRGRLLRVLLHGYLPSGSHHAVWDGRDQEGNRVRSGIYYARLEAGGSEVTRKMVLLE